MITDELRQRIMELPLADRVDLAEALWESIESDAPQALMKSDHEAVEQARQRDNELSSGHAQARTHEQVMSTVRRATGCD